MGSGMSRNGFLTTTAIICIAAATPALAQSKTFDVPAQSATTGIAALGRQADIQIVAARRDTRGKKTNAVRGNLTVDQALAQLFEGTGLTVRRTGQETYSVIPLGVSGERTGLHSAGGRQTSPTTGDPVSPGGDEIRETPADVVVTGSNIRGVAPAGSPLVRINRTQIEQTGSGSTQDFIRTIPQNFTGGQSQITDLRSQVGLSNVAKGTAVNLRGLGADETLVLVDGRRLAPSGSGDFVDISAIPIDALSSVEILTDGASATYGSDAISGVINFRLRSDLSGGQTRLRYGSSTDGGAAEFSFSHIQGATWAGGHVIAGVQYQQRAALFARDRDFTASYDLRPLGGGDYRSTFSSPGNITSPTGLAGAIPSGSGASLTSADILRGQTNLQNNAEDTTTMPKQTSYSGFISISQKVGSNLEIYSEALASRRDVSYSSTAPSATLSVPSTNAYRVANGLGLPGTTPITINYSFINDLGPTNTRAQSTAVSAVLGARYNLPSSWKVDIYSIFGLSRQSSHTGILDQRSAADGGGLATALASGTMATAFNPFSGGRVNNASVLGTFLGDSISMSRSRVWSGNIKVDGELFDLPAGAVRVAAGGEARKEWYDGTVQTAYAAGTPAAPSTNVHGSRNVFAEFGEIFVPIFSARNHIPMFETLELSASVRHDDYEGFGDTSNPKVGVRWSPGLGITFRSSWGTSFRAPRLSDLKSPLAVQYISRALRFGGPDRTGNGSTDLVVLSGGNPHLVPERGETWTAGLDFSPEYVAGLNVKLTYYNVRVKDRLGSVSISSALILANTAPYEGIVFFTAPSDADVAAAVAGASSVTGAPYGPGVTDAIYNTSLSNISQVKTSGLDISVDYGRDISIGRLGFNFQASKILNFENQLSAGSAWIPQADIIGRPIDFSGRATVSLTTPVWSTAASVNFKDDYKDTSATVPRTIKANATFDVFGSLELGALSRALGSLRLTFALNNVFNKRPPFTDSAGFAYDGANYSPVGRTFTLEIRAKW